MYFATEKIIGVGYLMLTKGSANDCFTNDC